MPVKKNKRGLTEKQQRFCDYYIASGNAVESARKAGYKRPNPQGCENLAKPNVKEYIDKRLKEIKTARTMNMVEVQELWASVARGEAKEERMGIDPKTRKAVKIIMKPSLKDRLKATDMIAKTHGAYTTNLNVTTPTPPVINLMPASKAKKEKSKK